jgi:hypothetical protein
MDSYLKDFRSRALTLQARAFLLLRQPGKALSTFQNAADLLAQIQDPLSPTAGEVQHLMARCQGELGNVSAAAVLEASARKIYAAHPSVIPSLN